MLGYFYELKLVEKGLFKGFQLSSIEMRSLQNSLKYALDGYTHDTMLTLYKKIKEQLCFVLQTRDCWPKNSVIRKHTHIYIQVFTMEIMLLGKTTERLDLCFIVCIFKQYV